MKKINYNLIKIKIRTEMKPSLKTLSGGFAGIASLGIAGFAGWASLQDEPVCQAVEPGKIYHIFNVKSGKTLATMLVTPQHGEHIHDLIGPADVDQSWVPKSEDGFQMMVVQSGYCQIISHSMTSETRISEPVVFLLGTRSPD